MLQVDASKITALLHQIPVNCDIIDVNPGDLASGDPAASRLWNLLRDGKDGLGETRTSKLLAVKRPHLIPIWDSRVKKATGLNTRDYWRQFQAVLTADDRAIWNWLTQLRSQAGDMPTAVSNLRILDVLLWMTGEQRQ